MKKPTDELRKLKAEKDAAFYNPLNPFEDLVEDSACIGRRFSSDDIAYMKTMKEVAKSLKSPGTLIEIVK